MEARIYDCNVMLVRGNEVTIDRTERSWLSTNSLCLCVLRWLGSHLRWFAPSLSFRVKNRQKALLVTDTNEVKGHFLIN